MSPGLTDSLTGSLTLPAAGRWNTDPMDTRTRQPTLWSWVLPFLAAIVAVLATILSAATASAATTAGSETRVGASSVVVEVLVGPPEHIGAGQRLGNEPSGVVVVVATGVAAKSGDEFVNLASEGRTTHILDGDITGGGHAWPGLPGKTPFPDSWSRDRIMHEISDVATDPSSIFRTGRGGSTIVTGTRDGVDIRVIIRNGDIVTGYPTNLPRN